MPVEWRNHMNLPFDNLLLFSLAFLMGITMITEGLLIVKLQKQIIPLPSRILNWISVGLVGKEKSTQRFTGKITPENLRTYAIFVLVFGGSVILSSLIYMLV
jgi:hypothetical protein